MTQNTDVATIDTTPLNNLVSREQILAFFQDAGINVNDNETDGIKSLDIVDNKDKLIGVPFLIVQWRFNESEKYKNDDGTNGSFVSAEVMLQDGTLLVLNDGSTGIARQLRELSDRRIAAGHAMPYAGRAVNKGLRKSEYDIPVEKVVGGKIVTEDTHGVTYYLDF
jgi:hypothetical protein